MNWTKEEIITEVLEYMDFSPNGKGLYKDNQNCWEDRKIEDLIYCEVDNMDNYEQDLETYKWLYDFCISAKKLFNMNGYLDHFIKAYAEEIKGE